MKKMYLYLILVLVIVAIAVIGWYYFSSVGMWRCGPCGCFNDECGSTTRYYWNCTARGTICSSTNPGNCTKIWGTC